VVCGVTASGKTEIAAELASRLDGEVIGADSRQVYRYMDLGTAKPPAELRARVRHHGIDVVNPDEDFDVSKWRDLATSCVDEIHSRGKVAIVCGGTGLYLRSLLRGLFAGPAADETLRAELAAEEAAKAGALHGHLARIDPEAAARIHPNDHVRLIRAIEVYSLTGETLTSWHARHGLGERNVDALAIQVIRPPAEIRQRIEDRAGSMVATGLLDEVRALSQKFDLDAKAFSAIGYREARDCARGVLAEEELASTIARATIAYAKRQRVWLRGQMTATAVSPGEGARVADLAREFLSPVATRKSIG
jgi:tRNA dimethylallyltransferase